MHKVMVQVAIMAIAGFRVNIKVSPFGCWQFWVTSIFDVTHVGRVIWFRFCFDIFFLPELSFR